MSWGRLAPAQFEYRRALFCNQITGLAGTWEAEIRLLKTEDGETVGAFFPDIITEVQFVGQIFCLAIRAEAFNFVLPEPHGLYEDDSHEEEDFDSRSLSMGLALVKNEDTDTNTNTFTRVGLLRWMKPALFLGCEEQLHVII
jgi:hypothetical protein